jgi:predicted RNase H-like HicB family nuclease
MPASNDPMDRREFHKTALAGALAAAGLPNDTDCEESSPPLSCMRERLRQRSVCGEEAMRSRFTLEFWRDGAFYVGRLLEVPGVFSQGETLEELRENIQDAYDLMVTQERSAAPAGAQQQPVELDI